MLCFYYSADLDGSCSAAIVYLYHPACELFPIDYGDRFPWEKIVPGGSSVWMVDFSLPIDQMIELKKQARLVWIDHHKTAIEAAARAGAEFSGLQRVGDGACQLVWEYLEPGQRPPKAVWLLSRYDVWDHRDPLCLPLQYGLRSYGWSRQPRSIAWRELLLRPQSETRVRELVSEGEAIMRFEKAENASRARVLCFEHQLRAAGMSLVCLAANWGPASSQAVDSHWDPSRFDAVLLYHWRPAESAWRCSLYTDRGDVDVSGIAQAFGGGGHRGAAGFQVSSLAQIGL